MRQLWAAFAVVGPALVATPAAAGPVPPAGGFTVEVLGTTVTPGNPKPGLLNFILNIIDALGEVGVGVLVFLESVMPPLPSEVMLPAAGMLVSLGRLDVPLTWIWALIAWLFISISDCGTLPSTSSGFADGSTLNSSANTDRIEPKRYEGATPTLKLAEWQDDRIILYAPAMVKDTLPYAILLHYQNATDIPIVQ